MAPFDFFVHLLFDLVQRHVSGTFDHYLHVVLPGFAGEFTQRAQLGELRFVAGVGNAAGPQPVAQRV